MIEWKKLHFALLVAPQPTLGYYEEGEPNSQSFTLKGNICHSWFAEFWWQTAEFKGALNKFDYILKISQ